MVISQTWSHMTWFRLLFILKVILWWKLSFCSVLESDHICTHLNVFLKVAFFLPSVYPVSIPQVKHLHPHNTHTDTHTSRPDQWVVAVKGTPRKKGEHSEPAERVCFLLVVRCHLTEIKTENKKWLLCVRSHRKREIKATMCVHQLSSAIIHVLHVQQSTVLSVIFFWRTFGKNLIF